MAVQTLEMNPAVPFAKVIKLVQAPLKIPAWSVVAVVILAGVYGYVSGRQNPTHHYVPYVGYPLVLDTTTGKSCYSSTPKPYADGLPVESYSSADAGGAAPDPAPPADLSIPMCGNR